LQNFAVCLDFPQKKVRDGIAFVGLMAASSRFTVALVSRALFFSPSNVGAKVVGSQFSGR
jgi:hypothetical protein